MESDPLRILVYAALQRGDVERATPAQWRDRDEAGLGIQLLLKVAKPEPQEEETGWTTAKVKAAYSSLVIGDIVRVQGFLERQETPKQLQCLLLSSEAPRTILEAWSLTNPDEFYQGRPIDVAKAWRPSLHVTDLPSGTCNYRVRVGGS